MIENKRFDTFIILKWDIPGIVGKLRPKHKICACTFRQGMYHHVLVSVVNFVSVLCHWTCADLATAGNSFEASVGQICFDVCSDQSMDDSSECAPLRVKKVVVVTVSVIIGFLSFLIVIMIGSGLTQARSVNQMSTSRMSQMLKNASMFCDKLQGRRNLWRSPLLLFSDEALHMRTQWSLTIVCRFPSICCYQLRRLTRITSHRHGRRD